MKFKLALSTATALGLLMGGALANDNKTKTVQHGENNSILVDQDGSNNIAGQELSSASTSILRQGTAARNGNNNTMEIRQTGDHNRVGGNHGDYFGAHQDGDNNLLIVNQDTVALADPGSSSLNGNIVQAVRQNAMAGSATSNAGNTTTNEARVTQGRPAGSTLRGTNFVGQIHQTLDGIGNKNLIEIDQTSDQTSGYGMQVYSGSTKGNRLGIARQTGTGNTIDVDQKGAGIYTTDTRKTGAMNHIGTIDQNGTGNTATVSQDGFKNYVAKVEQKTMGNTATIDLQGNYNGAALAVNSDATTVGAFTVGRGAALAGAAASSVWQNGTSNQVEYRVVGANRNQFGFFQEGTGNQAIDIQITGDANELGVYQDGTDNKLNLSYITGSENIIGLIQNGTKNEATVNVSGDQNVGYNDFNPLKAAAGLGLTAGLLEQYGTFNQVSLTVTTGNNNVFASLQDNTIGASTWNKITATQNGSSNEAAVSQVGNQNTAVVSQNGSFNNVSISQ